MVAGEQKNIRVIVRVRPPNSKELELNSRMLIKVLDNTNLLFDPDEDEDEFFFQGTRQHYRDITKRVHKKLNMEFDRVFDDTTNNENIFEDCTKPLVASVMDGYNCSVFVYGATGAGKTFTMLGNDQFPGITFLTMKELFNKVNELSDDRKFDVGVSYLEVYNEQVMNLLTKMGPLKLREDSSGGVFVSGLSLKPIFSAEELLDMLEMGNKNRTQHPTDANAESSRSHAIFQVHIRMTDNKTKQKRTVKLSMIDLAGSERAASTKGIGARFKEGASINKSLLALGNCINKLADGLKHIPYRDSNLTRILKDSLGGNCQTVMIANISPSSLTYEDTYNTLKYASRAKKIRTTVHQNVLKTNMPKDYYVKKFGEQSDEIERLKATIKKLEQTNSQNAQSVNAGYDENDFKIWCRKIDTVFSNIIKSQENYFNLESKQKIFKFRLRQKQYTEVNRKILDVNLEKLNEDITRIVASIDRFEKQINEQSTEIIAYQEIHKKFLKDYEKLRSEISKAKSNKILEIYLRQKDAEISASKYYFRVEHFQKVQKLYNNEIENYRKMCSLALNTIQKNYHLLRANNLMEKSLEENYAKLCRLICNYSEVKFDNNDEESNMVSPEIGDTLELQNSMKLPSCRKRLPTLESLSDENEITNLKSENENNIKMKKSKMINKENDLYNLDLNDFNFSNLESENDEVFSPFNVEKDPHIFKMPAPVIAVNNNIVHNPEKISKLNRINGTDGLRTESKPKDALNSTFVSSSVTPSKDIANINMRNLPHKDFINNVLNEHNVKLTTSRDLVSKALVNKPRHLLRAVQLGISKENKRNSPNRVRKSPRAIGVSNALLLSRQRTKSAPRTQSDSNGISGPSNLVRTNRAATLRVKK